jgi:hypothetical protein
MMHSEGTFARLVELVQTPTIQEDTRLHQLLLQLLYESSRIQRLTREDFSMSKAHGLATSAQSQRMLTLSAQWP